MLHLYIWEILEGRTVGRGKVLHHMDKRRYNNNLSNLKEVTHATNNSDRIKRSGTSSGYTGVRYRKDIGKWEMNINADKTQYSKTFDDEAAAAKAYDTHWVAIHGLHQSINNLLTSEEIDAILANRDQYRPVRARAGRKLPTYISKCKKGFRVRMRCQKYQLRFNNTFAELEHAVAYKDECVAEMQRAQENY